MVNDKSTNDKLNNITNERRLQPRKTTILGFNKLSSIATILFISKALSTFSTSITQIKISPTRFEHRNAFETFDSAESCEKAKGLNTIKLGGEECITFFVHSSTPSVNLSASENKLYIKYR